MPLSCNVPSFAIIDGGRALFGPDAPCELEKNLRCTVALAAELFPRLVLVVDRASAKLSAACFAFLPAVQLHLVQRNSDVPREVAALLRHGGCRVVVGSRRYGRPFEPTRLTLPAVNSAHLRLGCSMGPDGAISLRPFLEHQAGARLGHPPAKGLGPGVSAKTLAGRGRAQLLLEEKLCRLAAAHAGTDPALAEGLSRSLSLTSAERIALALMAPGLGSKVVASLTEVFREETRGLARLDSGPRVCGKHSDAAHPEPWSWAWAVARKFQS